MSEGIKCPLSGWEIVRTIGSGSYGKVYEIRKSGEFSIKENSALKWITIPTNPDVIKDYIYEGYDEASIAALFRSQVEYITSEFELMSRLKGHSNIVGYEDHSVIRHKDGLGWDILIRMELLTSLPRFFSGRSMTEEDVITIGIDISKGLELCAKRNIIHRDIKPQNIFVNDYGCYKLGDFGIAKASEHTTRGTKTGTFGYMAPEVYRALPYNATIDIYSLGMVLYWCLNMRRGPFLALPPEVPKAGQNIEALDRRMRGEPLPPPVNGSRELKRIVLKASAFLASDRYSNPTELRQDLERLRDGGRARAEKAAVYNDEVRTLHGGEVVNREEDDEVVELFAAEKTLGLFGDSREEAISNLYRERNRVSIEEIDKMLSDVEPKLPEPPNKSKSKRNAQRKKGRGAKAQGKTKP
ncbi:MAG: protein kinase [Clostridia bacterium]|nr:protein kinase [Clostridia bacterium]